MGGKVLSVGGLKDRTNFVPLPYRCVSFQPYAGEMSETAIVARLLNRELYRRTDIVVLHEEHRRMAVAAVQRMDGEQLFTRAEKVEVLALPQNCVFIKDPETDPANPSALGRAAKKHGISAEQTAVVMGMFDHVNVIHRPDPLLVRVVEVTPPTPPKLYHMVQHVLSYADLPPIELQLETIDLRDLCGKVKPEAFLVPCRSGGLDDLGAPVFFLDERPKQRRDWTLIGCERSLQFHLHYYGDEPPRVEMCPRRLTADNGVPTLLKCCLLEFDIEQEANIGVVPWGADLGMVEAALRRISEGAAYA